MRHKLTSRRGITGPELVVVASIIAILIGLLVPNTDELDKVIGEIENGKPAPSLRTIGTALKGYGDDFRTIASGLNEVFAEAVKSGKLDTVRLRFLSMKLMVAQDETDIAVDLVRDAMQDKDLSKGDRKLMQSALPVLVQIRAELHTLGVLIGLLLPAPDAGGAAAAKPAPARSDNAGIPPSRAAFTTG